MIRANLELPEGSPSKAYAHSPRRRRAVAVADFKSCALIETRFVAFSLIKTSFQEQL
jgi:hypothetical protein